MKKFSRILVMLLAVGLIGMMTACDNSTEPEESDVEVLANHMDAALQDWSPTYPPGDLFTEVSNDNAPFILSVRRSADYDELHIKGAVNVPFSSVADVSALDNAGVPTGQMFVDYCYTGHSGQAAATVMKFMGYDVRNLKFGMMAWYSDAANGGAAGGVAPYATDTAPPTDSEDWIEQDANNLPESGTYDLPDLDFAGATNEEMAASAAQNWVGGDFPAMSATDLFTNLNDGDTSNDPMILSVRTADHYAAGHIPGAYNIPWRDIAKVDNLTKLDPDQEIVVYCYTGHTGQVATTVLKNLGYDAKNLLFGMMGWTTIDAYRDQFGLFDPTAVFNADATVEGLE